jgi:hypothetical protein
MHEYSSDLPVMSGMRPAAWFAYPDSRAISEPVLGTLRFSRHNQDMLIYVGLIE